MTTWLYVTVLISAAILVATHIPWRSALTPVSVLQLLGLWMLIATAVLTVRRWWRGRQGLDQWPSPYGKLYDEWLRNPSGQDYYAWLASKHEWQEPWASWARMDRQINEEIDRELDATTWDGSNER